ncbi:MAG TPA: winged helix-turn-helix transcriptional regulator [Candidatus Acidoferrum sp.]|nr:winged helix-turn-helix transcriptional regulator [Candidatus Acidoferrum sp.]
MDPFNCPVTVTTHIIGGKWKPSILYYLQGRIRRFSELHKLLSGPTKKCLRSN